MALVVTPSPLDSSAVSLKSHFTSSLPEFRVSFRSNRNKLSQPSFSITCSSSPYKIVRYPKLDKHVVKQNRIRFVQKLKTLLLSKPKHFMQLHIIYKCRSYLSLPKPRSVLSMIKRYPTIFELFAIPVPPTPLNAAGSLSQLCVRLTPAAAALAKREHDLKKYRSISLVEKLQKLLMLASPYNRLLLSKLAHLGPDLGLPVNFRSRLCNDHPDRFKTVDTSYGRALELVSWDSNLAKVFPSRDESKSRGLIVDRPLKFKRLHLRKGLNVKRRHHDYLVKFQELPDICPYNTNPIDFPKESIEAEKRACAIIREVLAMTVEKRTLIDHLTHFRNEFGLPNKTRAMLVRHPEMFYISVKGTRNSVFLVEAYNDRGNLVEKDEILSIRDELHRLVREGKKMRRESRKKHVFGDDVETRPSGDQVVDDDENFDDDDDEDDGLDDLFCVDDDRSFEDNIDYDDDEDYAAAGSPESAALLKEAEFWVAQAKLSSLGNTNGFLSGPW
ncbi:protein WHAT'S THIS FACTOR 1, chloroplastic [Andrographis paniculata]|uniref:protein WHAT'S THIS FACTOR 1, chloroplastic n=1 Tax=Andrographis paniculata TaxID=175694 RepID=UPI0021E7BED5|nr:protein WHAT'S THIS FACTOR 1, chloroplastic [Andrographis paniculata]XP_051117801.1 protein WHAT'S THIS FACTOR 1, chloroplastic [Andrographis paniculata]XP_051117802.1 protein WHAT'S THIS FACTOR 1, chloroplastic [Andrographis paniculata]